MRAIESSSFIGSLLLLLVSPCAAQNDIPWIADPYQARQLAAQQQRLLLLHFYTDWCPPCRKLERDVFPRPEVIKIINANFVAAKINAERFKEVAKQLKVESYPTDVILDPQGREVFRGVTPQDPLRYSTLLSNVSSRSGAGNAALAQGPRVPGPEQPAANSLLARNDPYQSNYGAAASGLAASGAPAGRDARAYGNPPPQDPARNWQTDPSPPPPGMSPATSDPRTQLNPYVVNAWQGPVAAGTAPAAPPDPRGAGVSSGGYEDNRLPLGADPAGPPAVGRRPGGVPARDVALRDNGERRAARPPQQEAPLAMEGYCPVTLTDEERWQRGNAQWGAIHREQTYLFASAEQQQKFLADPDRYSPVLAGYDPVRYIDRGEPIPGKRQHGMWYRGKTYLFADEASLDQFSAKPDLYAQKTHQAMLNSGR